ncbi:MAG: WD40-repeat-containing domain protein, partial [Olpidium bornovanus]
PQAQTNKKPRAPPARSRSRRRTCASSASPGPPSPHVFEETEHAPGGREVGEGKGGRWRERGGPAAAAAAAAAVAPPVLDHALSPPARTEAAAAAGSMEVHRCRFVDYTPATINALAFAPSTCQRPYAACARASGDIEIWSPLNNWHLERTIPGSTRASVEALAWTHQTEPCDSEVDEDNGKDDETDAEGDIEPDKKAKGRNLVEKKAKRTAQRKNGRQPTQPSEREKKRLHALPPRLFTAGLDAILREWDLDTLRPKKVIDSHGGAVWCVAASNDQKRLAIGCEDGRVRIFDVADGRLEYIKALDPHRGRVLSLAWDPTDSYIVTGSAESTINKYDVESGRSVARMLVEKASKSEHTIVWAIKVLADGTVVSGDSLGHVKFWDLRMGVLRQSISSHAADVLCLAVGRDSTTVFSSGVDRVVNRYKVVEVQDALDATKPSRPKASRSVPAADSAASATAEPRQAAGPQKKWVISGRRRYHSHDVRALALDESKRVNALVSGGVDVQLVVCPAAEFPALNQRRLPFFPHRPVVSFVKAKRWVVAALFDKLRIWLLGKGGPTTGLLEEKRAEILPIVEHQRRLLEMQLQGGRHITAFDVSM